MAQNITRILEYADKPPGDAVAVTPSDTVNLTVPSRALYVGGAGNIVAVMQDSGTAVTFTGVLAGTVLPIRVLRVNATSTTATSLVALF